VKSKILYISLAVVLALSIGLIGCEGEEDELQPSDTIVLAASVSEDGPLSPIHYLAKDPIVALYTDLYPTITVGSTDFDVEVVYKNDSSDLDTMLDNTDDIIDEIGAGTSHFLLGPTCTAFLEAQATKCTTGKVVQMTMEGGATSLFPKLRQYKYSFVNLSFSNWFEIPVLAKMLAEAHDDVYGDTPIAVVGYQDDDHGEEYMGEAEKYFAKEGITIEDSMPMTGADPNNALVAMAKAADSNNGADILCVFGYTDWTFTIHGECIAQSYEPKALVLGPGANFGAYTLSPPAAGGNSTGVVCFATANNKTAGNAGDVIQALEAEYSMFGTDFWGHPCYWAALDFIYAGAAAEGDDHAGEETPGFTIDQGDFRSYCAETKLDSAFGETWYVTPDHALNATQYSWDDTDLVWPVPDGYAGLMNYKCHTGEIGQWQAGYIEIVGYSDIGTVTDEYKLTNYDATANFTYPKPVWP
jgi:hypothetical protein